MRTIQVDRNFSKLSTNPNVQRRIYVGSQDLSTSNRLGDPDDVSRTTSCGQYETILQIQIGGSHEGFCRLSVAAYTVSIMTMYQWRRIRAFKVEENIGPIILEHLRHQFDIDVLDIDFLARRYLH